ncbi:hypothetical protein F542_8290 [Bibersteinia trehalosi USDA-ARS-USMARC-188]|uniref:UPF0319 protein F542_8290 n=2 Tax=Bibersteinia trehalosi TaxID=47735 RepID=A0A4V7I943_BIBTR|nr:DUF2057 domain-containing protein [Bibersteinia trehalosi]AGH38652.1 hypothetical protein WQG_13750 [Bibersteinia trehalosi USDA-ARS-USMARC-192]AHG81547.1 hypothetical protein F542_8290 [Bibersteinia trehalosi USDA-ARS-USMARC-188]AHG83822.1 hypothetical protein F543_9580 [Bibersteinia trehalosi USDA-ARS-USMARC-189]
MKLGRIAIAIAALSASTLGLTATLTSSSNISFLAFDGQKVKKNTPTLQVNENQTHQAVVEVTSIYSSGSDESFYESSPIIVTFKGSNENIVIAAPNLTTKNDVAKFQQSPVLKVSTASGKQIESQQDILKGEGFMPNANIVDNIAAYNAAENKAAIKGLAATAMPIAIASNGKAAKGKVMVQGENIAEQQLQYWFQQADKETQKRFLDWAKKQ